MRVSMADELLRIRPHVQSFLLKHYGWPLLAALLLLPAGYVVLAETQVMEFALGLWAVAALTASVAGIHAHLYRRVYVAITREEVVHEHGILNHHKSVVPLNKITDTSVFASWFDRLLGVATLHVNTAGGKDFEIVAQDFSRKDVDALNNELTRLMRAMPDSLPDNMAKK